jgi:uncharacterized protein (TIGR03437 family)
VPPGSGMPTGRVQFVNPSQGTILAVATLSGGSASAAVPMSAGSSGAVAIYSGDSNFQASTSAPLLALSNAASRLSTRFSPDEAVSAFNVAGLNGDTAASVPLSTSFAGVSIQLTDSAGVSHAAPIYGAFASASQVNFVIPADTAPGTASLAITLPGGGTVSTMLPIVSVAPAIFTANGNGEGVFAGQIVYVHADTTQTVASSVVWNAAANTYMPNPISFASPTDRVTLVLYATGIRHAAALTATVNGVNVQAAFAPQGEYAGLDQINLQLPRTLAGAGAVNILITADGQPANPVSVAIQ